MGQQDRVATAAAHRGFSRTRKTVALQRTQKKCFSFLRTKRNYDSDTSRFISGQGKLRQRYIARRKSILL
ncbi:hypothetical protein [Virgibacillus proomii]|uniref:hypothetical protein n=1 Tax=Virgibacillus proomii TaxID=84407 RepID=UPI001C10D942|nr:hypothetical protein [Virgibacillus proomii]MBU5266177.1 hypothetical protein [Virgibacillus proomii]